MAKKKFRTLKEFLAEMESDPEWVQSELEREAAHAKFAAELDREEKPLVEDLNLAGANVHSVYDLLPRDTYGRQVIEVLMVHLARPYHPNIKEGIARALATTEATQHWAEIRNHFEQMRGGKDQAVIDALALAVALSAGQQHVSELVSMAEDPRYGGERTWFVYGLGKLKDPIAKQALNRLEADEELRPHVKAARRGRFYPG